ncbi:MAG: transcriptional repressor LexA [Deltaproteobacteria bacterium]|nr:transcriptional repressor LexA [Deltaproteobacteria bacterium]
MQEPLTSRQQEVLDFITRWIEDQGYPPTLREIGEELDIRSTNGVNDHLKALERKGYLRRDDLKSRALRPVTMPSAAVAHVPVVGRVAAGQPLLAEENISDTLRLDRSLVGAGDDIFSLRVTGESMIEDGIFDGDYVFVRPDRSPRAGEIVVALIDGEATVKRFFPDGDVIRLQPANAAMEPIVLRRSDERDLQLVGVVIGVYRRL